MVITRGKSGIFREPLDTNRRPSGIKVQVFDARTQKKPNTGTTMRFANGNNHNDGAVNNRVYNHAGRAQEVSL